jgi:hypothetical protein
MTDINMWEGLIYQEAHHLNPEDHRTAFIQAVRNVG